MTQVRLFLTLSLVLISSSCADIPDNTLLSTYQSPNGDFSFEYPAGWQTNFIPEQGELVVLSNSDGIPTFPSRVASGQVIVLFTANPEMLAMLGVSQTSFNELLVASRDWVGFSKVEELTLGGVRTLHVPEWRNGSITTDIFLRETATGGIYAVYAYAPYGELDAFRSVTVAIAESTLYMGNGL